MCVFCPQQFELYKRLKNEQGISLVDFKKTLFDYNFLAAKIIKIKQIEKLISFTFAILIPIP